MYAQNTLSAVLSEFARTLVTDFPVQGILDHLVGRIVDILPITAAGVSLISPTTHPRLIAGSDESAVRFEHLQTVLGEGPCLAAYESDAPISIPNLAEDDRFPRFAKGALEQGLVAVFTFPLRNDDRGLGALDLYRTSAGRLQYPDMETAQTLADVATAYLLNAEARTAKTDLVATVSHELRTPMTNIRGFVELLQDGMGGVWSAEQEEFVNVISRNSDRLTSMANDLLTVASLESARHEHVSVDMRHVLHAAQQTLDHCVGARHLGLTFEMPADAVTVRGHEPSLESLVRNLVDNAVKFTPDGGWVRCALSVRGGTACVEVADNGLGIPKAEQQDLFSKFFRSSTAHEHEIQGTGLGLTIVDSVVRNHGGEIAVVSEHLRGTTFTVTLPLADE